MARAVGTFFNGSFTGVNQVEDLYDEVETRLQAFQSNGVDAWEEYDVITPTAGSRDVVFGSVVRWRPIAVHAVLRIGFRSLYRNVAQIHHLFGVVLR